MNLSHGADWVTQEKGRGEGSPAGGKDMEVAVRHEGTWFLEKLKGDHDAWSQVRRQSMCEMGLERWQGLILEIAHHVRDLGF